MKNIVASLGIALLAGGLIALCSKSEPFIGGLFFAPFSLFPLLFSLLMICCFESRISVILLTLSMFIYAAWFAYAYLDIFYIHPDPQSAIGLIFLGFYSLPVMGVFWIASFVINH